MAIVHHNGKYSETMIIAGREAKASTIHSAVGVTASGSTSKVKANTENYQSLRILSHATGGHTVYIHAIMMDGKEIQIASGNGFFDVELKGIKAVNISATDTSAVANTITVEAYLS